MTLSDSFHLPGLLREGKAGYMGRERQVPALPYETVHELSRAPVLGVQRTSLLSVQSPHPLPRMTRSL